MAEQYDHRKALDRILACAVFFHGAKSLADLADIDFATLLAQSGLDADAPAIGFAGAAEALREEVQIGARFSAVLDELDERCRVIARMRTYARKPERLAMLGDLFGVSRERARQLEVRLRWMVDQEIGDVMRNAGAWLHRAVGSAAPPDRFDEVVELFVNDARPEWREATEVAVMAVGGFRYMDGVVGDKRYREWVTRARQLAPQYANSAGVVDEAALQEGVGAADAPEWEALVRNAGLVRLLGHLALRDTRRARVFLTLDRLGAPSTRPAIAKESGLPDNSSLSSLLSSDRLFVRYTKDKWGLRGWTYQPYGGVVDALVRRIREGGGRARVDMLVRDIPAQFEVLPATVRNYLGTPRFEVEGRYVRIADAPVAPAQPLGDARDVVWQSDGTPVLRFTVGRHHMKGNSQKVSHAVAQYLGLDLDASITIPFEQPDQVHDASLIWRSYDPNGPEMGHLREALIEGGVEPGEEAFVVLGRDRLRLTGDGERMLDADPTGAHAPSAGLAEDD